MFFIMINTPHHDLTSVVIFHLSSHLISSHGCSLHTSSSSRLLHIFLPNPQPLGQTFAPKHDDADHDHDHDAAAADHDDDDDTDHNDATDAATE